MKRNHFFDVLKGIAIILVIITHYWWSDYERQFFLFPFLIDMAVPVFMLITGRFWALSIISKYDNPWGGWRLNYLSKKILSFGVPFLFAFLVEFIAYTIFYGLDGTFSLYTLLRGGNGPGSYYFPVLIQLLFIFPLILYVIDKWDYFGLWICFIANFLYEFVIAAYQMNEECYRLLVFRYIFVIAAGIYHAIGKKKIPLKTKLIAFLFGVAFIVLTYYYEYQLSMFNYWTTTCLISCLYIIPIFSFFCRVGKSVKIGFLELIGRASYSIFLVQMVYFYCLDNFVYEIVQSTFMRLLINCTIIIIAGLIFNFMTGIAVRKIDEVLRKVDLDKKLLSIVNVMNK